jgi:hypothetical protein
VTCPTCGGGMNRLCRDGARVHHWCPACGTRRVVCGYGPTGEPVTEDAVPELVRACRAFEARHRADADRSVSVALAFQWGDVAGCLGAGGGGTPDVAGLRALVLKLADRLTICSELLGRCAERRGV